MFHWACGRLESGCKRRCLAPHDPLWVPLGGLPVEGAVEDGEGALQCKALPPGPSALLLEQKGARDEAGELEKLVLGRVAEGGAADDGVDGDVAGGSPSSQAS